MARKSSGHQAQRADVVEAPSNDEWFDIDGAAAYLNKPRRFILRLVAERRIRHFKHGKYIAFRKKDLEEWGTRECREAVR